MREHGASPAALLLLGLISDAGGDFPAAAKHYRKVLYLDPDHPEVLGHLALLLEKQGDVFGAKLLNDRLRRLHKRMAGQMRPIPAAGLSIPTPKSHPRLIGNGNPTAARAVAPWIGEAR